MRPGIGRGLKDNVLGLACEQAPKWSVVQKQKTPLGSLYTGYSGTLQFNLHKIFHFIG